MGETDARGRYLATVLHVGFKIAAQLGDTYLDALEANREIVSRNVTGNLLERHMKPLFQILRV